MRSFQVGGVKHNEFSSTEEGYLQLGVLVWTRTNPNLSSHIKKCFTKKRLFVRPLDKFCSPEPVSKVERDRRSDPVFSGTQLRPFRRISSEPTLYIIAGQLPDVFCSHLLASGPAKKIRIYRVASRDDWRKHLFLSPVVKFCSRDPKLRPIGDHSDCFVVPAQ